MLTKDEVIKRLRAGNLTHIAAEVGVTRVYLSKLVNGHVPHASYDMIERLSDYLEKESR